MEQRLERRPHVCDYEAVAYTYGTHFVLPESMLRIALPIGLKFVMRFLFRSAKGTLMSARPPERTSYLNRYYTFSNYV